MKYRDFAPAMKFGAKIYPEDLAGMIGLPSVGNIYYVDASNGSDTANSGKSANDALATVAAAYAKCTEYQNDVVLLNPLGTATGGRTTETASIDWAKRFTHLIGNTAPIYNSPRAGMTFSSAATSPCFTISDSGCIFKNMTITTSADLNVLVNLTGSRNYFGGVSFLNANATAGDDTAFRLVAFDSGDGENLFEGCTFGNDSVARTGANYSLGFEGGNGNPRNVFKDCIFSIYADADAPRHAIVAHGSCDRYEYFENCLFTSNADTTAPVALTDVFETDVCGDQGGVLILKDCMQVGHTGWASQLTGVRILGSTTNDTELTDYSTGVNPAA